MCGGVVSMVLFWQGRTGEPCQAEAQQSSAVPVGLPPLREAAAEARFPHACEVLQGHPRQESDIVYILDVKLANLL